MTGFTNLLMPCPVTGHTEAMITKSTGIRLLPSVYQGVSDHVSLHL